MENLPLLLNISSTAINKENNTEHDNAGNNDKKALINGLLHHCFRHNNFGS